MTMLDTARAYDGDVYGHGALGLTGDHEHTTVTFDVDEHGACVTLQVDIDIPLHDDDTDADHRRYAAAVSEQLAPLRPDAVLAAGADAGMRVTVLRDFAADAAWDAAWDTFGYPVVAAVTNLHNRIAAGPYIWDLLDFTTAR